ncbi:MAG: hypothetical protein ACTHJQ_27275 [Rhizobiaceae bacterium]
MLRAIAILMVIVSHIPPTLPWEWSSLLPIWRNYQTWSGVDLFFCVSGFVVTKSLPRPQWDRNEGGSGHRPSQSRRG